MPTQGLWNIGGFNLPDFGISEKLGVGPANASIVSPQMSQWTNNTVLPVGTTVSPNYSGQVVQGPVQNPVSNPGYNAPVVNNTNNNPVKNSNPAPSNPAPQQADPNAALMNEIQNAYNESMGVANKAESNLNNAYPGVQQDIQGAYDLSNKNLQGAYGTAQGQLTGAENTAQQRKMDVVNAARRLFNELSMGGQQRFGGASSAGQAYNELTGREFQRSNAQAEQGLTQTNQQIQQQRADLETKYQSSIASLEEQKNSQLRAAKADFDDKMLQIQQMKASAGENKANLRLQALQDLRNQTFQLQLQSENAKQQVTSQFNSLVGDATNNFNTNANAGLGLAQNYSANTTTNPLTSLTMGPSILASTGTQMTGNIDYTKKKDLFGRDLQ